MSAKCFAQIEQLDTYRQAPRLLAGIHVLIFANFRNKYPYLFPPFNVV
jgi:hypothetical protein